MDQSPKSSAILDLDEPLMLLALQEAMQILDETRQRLPHGEILDNLLAAQLRLTYYLMRCRGLRLPLAQVAALHRLSLHHLARRLDHLEQFQDRLHRGRQVPGSLPQSAWPHHD